MKITIYTITDCQFSKQEKEYLATHNLPFEEKNLETNHEYLTEMLNVSNNFAGTPVTKLEKDDGSTVVLKGFTAEEVDKELGFAAEGKPAEQQAVMSSEDKPKDAAQDQQNAAPPAAPPEIPTPQPPAPVPQPTSPQPTTPEVPVVPPTIPDQNAQPSMDLPPLSMNNAPAITAEPAVSAPQAAPSAETAPAAESTIDDASLDAILNQLQEKTAAPQTPEQPAQPQTPASPPAGAPSVPDFGTSS